MFIIFEIDNCVHYLFKGAQVVRGTSTNTQGESLVNKLLYNVRHNGACFLSFLVTLSVMPSHIVT